MRAVKFAVSILVLAGLVLGGAWVPRAGAEQTVITWANPAGGDWWQAANWSPQIVPTETGHDALLVGTNPFVVHISAMSAVNLVGIGPDVTLSMEAGAGFCNRNGTLINGGIIEVTGDAYSNMSFSSNSAGTLEVQAAHFEQCNTISNDGVIRIVSDPMHNPATINEPCNWPMAIYGSGRIVLSGGGDPSSAIFKTSGGYDAYWWQSENHSIEGEGSVVGALHNSGRISANVPGEVLRLTDFYSGKTNAGVMEAVSGGILENGGTIIQDGSGIIRADGGTVRLLDGSWITGGTLASGGGSAIECAPGTVNLSHPTNTGEIRVPGGSTLVEWAGTLTNDGTIILNPDQVDADATLNAVDYTTLAGSGQVVLRTAGDPNDARIWSLNRRMTNGAGHTIRGEGRIETGVTNQGRISADVPGRVLQMDTGDKPNSGTMEAVGGGILNIYESWIDQSGSPGTIRADGGTIHLYSGVRVIAGILAATAGSAIEAASGTVYLNSPTIDGEFDVMGGTTLQMDGGTVFNHGTIVVNPDQVDADAVLQTVNWAWFDGAGEVILRTAGDVNDARLETPQYWRPTSNGANHTIRGEGTVSAIMTNAGLISADVPGRTLLVTALDVNTGTVRASGGHLEMPAHITNSGTVEVRDGGSARLSDIGANYGGNNLYRGSWDVHASSTLRLLGADVSVLQADVLLDGVGSNLYRDDGTTDALGSLTQVGLGGQLQVCNGRSLATAGSLLNYGTVIVGAQGQIAVPAAYTQEGDSTHGATTVQGVLVSAQAVQINGGVLDGDGTIEGDLASAGEVRPGTSVGHLTVDGDYQQSGSGTLTLEFAGAMADLHDQLCVTGQAQLAGTLVLRSVEGFTAHDGDSLVVMTYAGHAGAFDAIVNELGGTLEVEPVYRATHLTLLVTDPFSAIEGPALDRILGPALTARADGPGRAILRLVLPDASQIRVTLFDLNGRRVAVPIEGTQTAGVRDWHWNGLAEDGHPVSSGLYFVRADVTQSSGVRRVLTARLALFR